MDNNQQQPPPGVPITLDEDAIRYHETREALVRAGFTTEEANAFIAGILNTVAAESTRYNIAMAHQRNQGGGQQHG